MKKTLSFLLAFGMLFNSFSQDEENEEFDISALQELLDYQFYADSIDSTFVYQTGIISLGNGVATLTVPEGYKYLDSKQSEFVLTELWENPPAESLGLLFPEDESPMESGTYVVEIQYEEEGFVNDDDAGDIDYSDMMEEMKKDQVSMNLERQQAGYETVDIVGWASSPYYDSESKKLHWAKELKFETYDVNTLNYNIRVLGRKGFLILNAIGDIDVLETFNEDRDKIIASVEFEKGYRYDEFSPGIDRVAAYGVGGLVAGKVLAKVGFFALIIKFWKLIAIAVVGFFAAFKNKLFGKKNNNLPSNRE
jgi:uncharacterized membrane-anchored protein